jgi:3',5'-cyclic AMP phosphodiesterase CpdA
MRIAHFSDAHAFSAEGVPPWAFFNKRVLGLANLRIFRRGKHSLERLRAVIADINRQAPDLVCVTGDLTNLSLEPEFALAREVVGHLALSPEMVTIVPGNHDVYTLGAMRAAPFQKWFGEYARSDGGGQNFPLVRVRGEVAIIGLSTAVPSPPPLADGWLGKEQLRNLEGALSAQQGKFRIVLLHHPPYDNRNHWLRSLRDRGRFQEVLKRVGCELVLHGHEHRDLLRMLDGPSGRIPVICVGSATYSDERPARSARYNIYRIEGGRLAEVETWAMRSSGAFERYDSEPSHLGRDAA